MKKLVSFLLIVMLTMNAWTGVFADVDPDMPAVQEADTFVDIAPDVEPEPVPETEQGESGMSREDALAENSATNIAPEAAGVEGIKAELNTKGCAYFAVNYAEGTLIYADNKAKTVLCELDSESAIFYTDLVEDGMLRVWFAVPGGSVMTGWLSASYGSLPLNEEEIAGMAETLPCVTATVGEKEASLFVVELKAKEAEPVEDIAPVVDGTDEEQAPEDKQDIVPVVEEEEDVDLDAGNADGVADVPDENADSASDDPAPDVSNIEPEAPVVPDEDGDAEESDKVPENNDTNKPVEDVIPEEIPAEQSDNATDRSMEDADAAEDKKEDAPSDTADLPQEEEEVPSPEIVPVVEGSDEEQPAEEKQDVVPAEKEDDNAPAEEAKEGGFVNEPEEEQKQDNTGFVKDEDEKPEEKPEETPAEELVEEPKAEEVKDEGSVKGDEVKDDEVDEDLEPAADENAEIVPEGSSEIAPSKNVSVVLKNGTIPEGAAVVSSEYASDEAKLLYDRYVLGIEEEPVGFKRGALKSAKSIQEENVVPELTGEEAEASYADGVTTKQIPGTEKTGTHTGYAVFSVGINVNGEEYNAPGEYDVTITPENQINIRNGIREDAEIQSVTFDVYHVHDGEVKRITLSDDDVIMTADGDIESFTYTTSDFSDFIFTYEVIFTYTDPVTLITTPSYVLMSINNESIKLSDMLAHFGIYESLRNATVSFTGDMLLEFVPVEEDGDIVDYIIGSIQSFNTEETLTVNLANGNIVEIKVTDPTLVSVSSIAAAAPTLIDPGTLHVDIDGGNATVTNRRDLFVNKSVSTSTKYNSYSRNHTTLKFAITANDYNHDYNWPWKHGEDETNGPTWLQRFGYNSINFRTQRILTSRDEPISSNNVQSFTSASQEYAYCIQPLKQHYELNKPDSISNHKSAYNMYNLASKINANDMGTTHNGLTTAQQRAITWILNNSFPWKIPNFYPSSFTSDQKVRLAYSSAQAAIWIVLGYESGSSSRSQNASKPYFNTNVWSVRENYNTGATENEGGCLGTVKDIEYMKWLVEQGMAFGNKVPTLTTETTAGYAYNSSTGKYEAKVRVTSNCNNKFWMLVSSIPSGVTISGMTLNDAGTWYQAPSGTEITISSTSSSLPTVEFRGYEPEIQTSSLHVFVDAGNYDNSFAQPIQMKDMQSLVTVETAKGGSYASVVKNYTAEEGPQNGAVEVTKTSANTGAALSGATFRLTGSSVTYGPVDKVTGTDGKAKWDDLPVGTYTLSEVSAPTGYYVTYTASNVTVSGGSTTSVPVTNNRITGNVTVTKYRKQMYTGATAIPLSGAVLRLCNTGTTTAAVDAAGVTLPDRTTGSNGAIQAWVDVPYGTYDIVEITPPAGYQNAGKLHTFSITTAGQNVAYTPSVENEPIYGSLNVKKVRSDDSSEVIQGAQFELLNSSKTARAKTISNVETGVVTTNSSGTAGWTNIEYGTYYIHEISTVDGYYLNPNSDAAYQAVTITTQNEGPTKTFQASNIAQTWTINVKKTDSATGGNVSGAVFTVTRLSGMDYGKSNRAQSWTMTTNANGEASLSGLTKGNYKIEETTFPPNYDSSVGYSQTFTLSTTDRTTQTFTYPTFNVTNTPKGKIKVIKVDSSNNNIKIANATFQVKNSSGTVVATLTTNASGEAETGWLNAGNYTIVETGVPTGYRIIATETSATITVAGATVTKTISNMPQGKIKVIKVEEHNNGKIAGATFQVKDSGGTVVANLTTNANGEAITGWLDYGNYTITETATGQSYYAIINTDTAASITAANQTVEKTIKNRELGKIKVTKIEEHNNGKIAGATFQVKNSGGTVVANLTTGSDGTATTGWLPYGNYTITETSTGAAYYAIINTDTAASITAANQTVEKTIKNRELGKIKVTKVEEHNNGKISGATFQVKNSGGTVVATLTTNANGEAVTGWLPYGNYTITETSTGHDYYAIIDTDTAASITAANQTVEKTIKNRELGKIKVTKVEEHHTGTKIAEAKFQVKNSSGTVVANLTTNANGEAITGWLPYGDYTITETSTGHDYYAIIDTNTAASITAANQTVEKTIKNRELGKIRVIKVNQFDNSMKIPNATFEIRNSSNTVIATLTTNANGEATSDWLPYGSYTITETYVPKGFLIATSPQSVSIENANTTYSKTFQDTPVGDLKLVKKNNETGAVMSGISFTLSNTEFGGTFTSTKTTDSQGKIEWLDLVIGDYKLYENNIPVGMCYVNDQDQKIEYGSSSGIKYTVPHYYPNSTVLNVNWINTVIRAPIEITKYNSRNNHGVLGAQFTIYDSNNNPVETITTNANGVARSSDLVYGVYTVRETVTPFGYRESTWSTTINITEHNHPYKRILYTDNLTNKVATYRALPVQKTLGTSEAGVTPEDAAALRNETYTFEIRAVSAKTLTQNNLLVDTPVPATNRVTIRGEGTASFPEIEFLEPGIYQYEVREIPGTSSIIYDNRTHIVSVAVEEYLNSNGEALLRSSFSTDGATDSPATFYNRKPSSEIGGCIISFPVKKTLTGDSLAESAVFNFELATTDGSPMPVGTPAGENAYVSVTLSSGQASASFENIEFNISDASAIGDHYYTIREVVPAVGIPGMTYDQDVHNIRVHVYQPDLNQSTLAASVYVDGVYKTDYTSSFENEYHTPASTNAEIVVTKTIEGEERPEYKTFTFTLAADPENLSTVPMPNRLSLQIQDEGAARFTGFTFNRAGDYKYLITETAGDEPGYTYDNSVWKVTIHVDRQVVGDSQYALVATTSYKKVSGSQYVEGTSAAFVNEYHPTPTMVTIPVRKSLTGTPRATDSELYTFSITADDASSEEFLPEPNTVSIQDEGEESFPTVTFTKAGEYSYTLVENAGEQDAITYDDTPHLLKVSVRDINGALTSSWTDNGQSVSTVNFRNNVYHPNPTTLELPVHKIVTGKGEPQRETFFFTLTPLGGAPAPVVTRISTVGEDYARFSSITFIDPGEYTYAVKEVNGTLSAYTYDTSERIIKVTVTDVDGQLQAVWTVDGALESYITFTNVYTPKPVTIQIPVEKVITGNQRPSDKETFQFTISSSTASAPMPERTSISITDAGQKSFGDITFDEPGTYYYTIKETAGSATGYTYDNTQHSIRVVVTDNNGQLEARWTDSDEAVDAVLFTNNYTPNPTSLILPVRKILTGHNTPNDAQFTFTLAGRNGAPMPVLPTATATGANAAYFGEINYTEAGTYVYIVTEEAGSVPGYTYDTAQHIVTVTVTDNHGTLQNEWTCDGIPTTEIKFTNQYVPEPVSLRIPVSKEITGNARNQRSIKTFSFKLEADDARYPMPVNDTVTITDAGTAKFPAILFDKAGTYTYTLSETRGTDVGYTYDTHSIGVTVSVQDVNGVLTATVSPDSSELKFTNDYTPEPVSISIPVSKSITGSERPDAKETFRFTLTAQSSSNPMPASNTITIVDEGFASFGEMTFTEEGTYTYSLQETAGSATGYTYDTTPRLIVVKVTDNNGVLNATWTSDGSLVAAVPFENTYTATPVDLQIPVKKTIEGEPRPTSKTFTFELASESSGSPIPSPRTITIADEGTASFPAITFTKEGSYVYSVRESAVNYDGYTTDTSVKAIVVTVRDINGNLEATWTCDGSAASSVEFINQYQPTPVEWIVPVKKVITGSERSATQKKPFTFTMVPVGTAPISERSTVTVLDEGETSFGKIVFNKAGTYQYTVSETSASEQGYTYDSTSHTLVATVTDNNGKLELSWTDNGTSGNTVTFTNNYTPSPITLEIPVSKVIEGNVRPDQKETFRFRITGHEGAPMPASTTINITDVGQESFGAITYEAAGVYTYTVMEMTASSAGYTYDFDEHTVVVTVTDANGRLSATWMCDGRLVEDVPFTNEYHPVPVSVNIPVAKEITGDERPAQKETFIFTLAGQTGNEPMPGRDTITIKDEGFENFGNMTFTEAGIYNYTVTETSGSADGYSYDTSSRAIRVEVTDNNGTLRADWYCNGDIVNEVLFTNEYHPIPARLEIPVVKTIEGNDRPANKETFEFTLRPVGEAPMPATSGASVQDKITIIDEGREVFEPIIFEHAGRYVYKLSETNNYAPGYTYDTPVHTIDVIVTDVNGRLVVEWTDNSQQVLAVEFVNEYHPTPVEVAIPVQKVIEGNNRPAQKETFRFRLTETENAPVPAARVIEIEDENTAYFDEITFTAAGTYNYVLTEEAGSASGYTYDRTEHNITIKVTDNNGVLEAEWTDNRATVDTVTFTNEYAPAPVDVVIPVSKDITGNDRPDDKETFQFVISANGMEGVSDGLEQPMPETTEVRITDTGFVPFPAITYTEAGTYKYIVTETMGDSHGYTYDDTEHLIKVVVTDNNGILDATWTDNGQVVETVPFENNYIPDEVEFSIPIRKILEGQTTPTDKTFTFTLTPQDGAPAPNSTTTTTTGSETGAFEPITFTESGVYVYTISENAGSDNGYTYDNAQHVVVIRVTDNDGVLEVTWKADGLDVDAVEFTNTYIPAPVSIKIPITKTVEGNDREGYLQKTFWFNVAGDEDTLPAVTRVSITDNGEAEFGKFVYTEAGEYEYTITEETGVDRGYTYDDSIQNILVTVTDVDGELQAEWTMNGESVDAVPFLNTYVPASVETEIPVSKVITGNDRPEEKEFVFEIEDEIAVIYHLRNHVSAGVASDLTNGAKSNVPMPTETQISISDVGSAKFTGLEYTETGRYLYLIHEVNTHENSYTYDTSYAIVVVDVEDNNGALTVSSIRYIQSDENEMYDLENGYVTSLVFSNEYIPEPVDLIIPVSKTITGNARPDQKETFVFRLYATGNAPVPASNRVDIEDEGEASFEPITFTEAGTYSYILREETGNATGYTYDRSEHAIEAVVTDTDGVLSVEWTDDGETVEAVAFTNDYTPAPVDVIIPVSKDVTGNERPDEKETFLFDIAAAGMENVTDGLEQPMPAETQIQITDIGFESFPAMTYTETGTYNYTVTERMADSTGYTYDDTEHTIQVVVTDNNGILEATWTDNGSVVENVPFENDYNPIDAVLVIPVEKVITGDDRPDQKETFIFTLETPNDSPMPENNVVEITDEGTASFPEITYDTAGTYQYTLVETEGDAEGYTYDRSNHILIVTVTDEGGELVATWTDNGHAMSDANVVFTNRYVPTPTTVVIPVEKQITGNARPNAYKNTFKFTIVGEDGAPMPIIRTASIKDEGTAEFGEITLEHAGEYRYIVAETQEDTNGYTYDTTEHTIVITVEDENGHLTAVWTDNDEEVENVLFINDYTPAPVDVVIPVSKDITGDERPDEKETFLFTIEASGMENVTDGLEQPMPEETEIRITDIGQESFPAMTFTETGTYNYTVRETQGDATGYTYDETSHIVSIVVTDNAGTLEATWTCDEGLVAAVPFTNDYTPVPVTLEIPVTKSITGNERPDDKETFIFELAAESSNSPIPAERFVTIEDEGETTFAPITYEHAGTYNYSVRETRADSTGYTYDVSVKTVVVTVTDNAGTLEVTWTMDSEEEADAGFVNDYTPIPVEVVIPVSKDITGNDRPLDKETFLFTMEAAGMENVTDGLEQPMPALTEVQITDVGKVSFPAITYTETGTYNYIVKETQGDMHGYTYDDTEHAISVVVTDNHGVLEAVWTDNNETVSEVAFTNDYNPDDATLEIPVSKAITGDERPEDKETFTFCLNTPSDSNAPMPDETEITIEDEGTANFPAITYDTAGTYVYTVSETAGTATGYTYDGTVHTIIVTVRDIDGVLIATYTIDAQDKEYAEFTNNYQPVETSLRIPVKKVITGNAREETYRVNFTFELEAVGTAPSTENDTITIRDEGENLFGSITFSHAGEYEYIVRERNENDRGYTYDDTEHTIKVSVVDNHGNLELTWVDNEETVEHVTFTNDYTPEPAILDIPVAKSIDGHERPDEKETFLFVIEATGMENVTDGLEQPMPESSEIRVVDEGFVSFEDITFTETGIYNYKITETAGDSTGYTYDTTEHDIRAEVVDVGGKLIVSWTDNELTVSQISFLNEYHPIPVTFKVPVTKLLTGHPTPNDKTFRFEISTTENAPLPASATVNATGAESVEFGEITYDTAGEYHYLVKEIRGYDTGYTYSEEEYPVTIIVTDNHGTLETSWKANDEEVESVEFTNTYYPTPVQIDIPVSKDITGNVRPDEKETFRFTLTPAGMEGTPDYIQEEPLPAATTINIVDAGYAYFESFHIDAIGTYYYKIQEIQGDSTGYTYDATEHMIKIVVTDNDGNLKAEWVDVDSMVGAIVFTNDYTPVPGKLELPIRKALTGQATPTDETFTFVLTGMDGAPMPETNTAQAVGANLTKFGEITYPEAGVYAYVVKEEAGSSTGYTYDNAQHVVIVTATDNHGTIEVSWKVDGRYEDEVLFTNNYVPLPVSLNIPVMKALTGNDRQPEYQKTFTFVLTPVSAESETGIVPMPVITEANIKDEGTTVFNDIWFTEAGVFTYEVEEVKSTDVGYTYDEKVHTIVATVTDNAGNLEVVWTDDGEDVEFVTFTNDYTPIPVDVTIPVNKEITGHNRPEGEEKDFLFTLVNENNESLQEIVIKDVGENSFDALTFTEVGEYVYDVTEKNSEEPGYTYDDGVKRIVITVIDHNGRLEASVTGTAVFTNTYVPSPTTAIIPVRKLLTGHETPSDAVFTFKILTTGDSPMPASDEAVVSGASDGEFLPITYDTAGTYKYIVREVKGTDKGYTYDTNLINVRVDVTDIAARLSAVVFIENEAVTAENDLAAEFTNEYQPTPVTLQIPVKKVLTGSRVTDRKDFTFTITPAVEGNPVPFDPEIVINSAGTAYFPGITFDAIGTYEYTVREVPEEYVGYTFDETEHTVVVTVTDNEGTLEATWTDNGETVKQIVFTNDYTPIPTTVKLPIIKQIYNQQPWQASTFRFAIEKDSETCPDPVEDVVEIQGTRTTSKANAFDVTFEKKGKYVYHVYELDEGLTGYTYDDIIYDVTVNVSEDDGELTADYVITYPEGNSIHMARSLLFRNEYVPVPTDMKLPVSKVITGGHERPNMKTFTFEITNESWEDMSGSEEETEQASMEYDHTYIEDEGESDFGNIHFTRAGVYKYTVTEKAEDWTGYTFDNTIYTAVISVADNNGKLEATWVAVDKEENEYSEIVFVNDYTPIPTEQTMPVAKVITGDPQPVNKTFKFTLTGGEGTIAGESVLSPMPEGTEDGKKTIEAVGQATVEFGKILLDFAGEFDYSVCEIAGNDTGYTYDSNVYNVHISVIDNDGRLEQTMYVNDAPVENLTITNNYMPIPVKDTLYAAKVMTGEDRRESEQLDFKFVLTAEGNAPMPAGSELGSKTISIHDHGQADFGEITYLHAGVYKYTIQEIDAKDRDYTCAGNVFSVTVTVKDNDGVLEIASDSDTKENAVFTNNYRPYRGRIIVEKTGGMLQNDTIGYAPLAGAVFEVRAQKDILGKDGSVWFKADELIQTLTTSENGLAMTDPLPFGEYYVTEISAPEGYVFSAERQNVTLQYKNADTYVVDAEVKFRNDMTEVKILKTDTMGRPLAGATFGLFNAEGKQLMTSVSDANGVATFYKVPYGKHTIREVIAPNGYMLSPETAEVNVDKNYVNENKTIATFVNIHKEMKFIKTDTSGNPLEGAEFALIDKATGKITETARSNVNGVFTLKEFGYGDWVIRETKAPNGFNTAPDVEIHVDETWNEETVYTIKDIPNHFELIKVDHKGNPLSGVKFTLEDENGTVLGEYVTGADGIISFTSLTPGRYVIRETATLSGFMKSDEAVVVNLNEDYVMPDEMYHWVNYPIIKTGTMLESPYLWIGVGLLVIAIAAGAVLVIKKRKVKAK